MVKTGRGEALLLECVEGPAIAPITVHAGEPAVIGRGEESTICLADSGVSRRHASIERRDAEWFVTDLDSRHGTFLNTIRIDAKDVNRLRHQDFLSVGPWAFCVLLTGTEVSSAGELEASGIAEVKILSSTTDRDAYKTRPTIFLRLGDSDTDVREVSWQEFSDRYRPIIVGFARNAGAAVDEADDVLQDVMLAFFRVSDAFEYDPAKGRFRGYLKTATVNALRARHRRERPGADGELDRFAGSSSGTDALWNWQWTRGLVERAMVEARPQFEARTWEAFELFGLRGVPGEEVAAQLGMKYDSVRHAKSRVARAVREIVARIRGEEG